MLEYVTYTINGIAINNLFYQIEEIKAGKTTNKTFIALMQWITNNVCFVPAYELFSNSGSYLSYLQFSITSLIVIANYLCYVYQSNQVIDSGLKDGSKKTLPFGLEDNKTLQNIAYFISQYIHLLQTAIFVSSICIAAAYGMTNLVIFSLFGVLLEQVYQRNFMPSMLANLYRLARNSLIGGLFLGWDNWFYIALNVVNILFVLGDYILTHLLGITTASVQFPISRKSNTFSFEESGLDKPKNQKDLIKFLDQIKNQPVELTFDHMRQSSRIIEHMSQNAKAVNYDEFIRLFKQVNFKDKELQSLIEAEITANDDYLLKVEQKDFDDLMLPPNASSYDIMISYLTNQINFMVDRLKSCSPRNLNHEQLEILKGQGRLILEHLKTLDPKKDPQFSRLMIELALTTGSHCSRVYLTSFSNIILHNNIQDIQKLSFKERVIVHTQEIKNREFTHFYYRFIKKLKESNNEALNILWSDTSDYHTFEDFALNFGSYFYLDNPTYSNRFRGIPDIAHDIFITILFGKADLSFLFSTYYHHVLLIHEVIEGKLSADFKEWCDSFYPNALMDLCMDEDYFIDPKNPNTIALATLMLLDCNIIQFKEPKSLISGTSVNPSMYQRCCARYHGFIEEKLRVSPSL